MTTNAFFAFIHFVAAFGVVTTVMYELITFQRNLSQQDAKRILKADRIYGLSALMVLLVGFTRVYAFEKGSAFYFSSPFFHLKLTAFIIVGLLSIYPTIRFVKWREFLKENNPPEMTDKEYSRIYWLLRAEVIGLLIVMFSASMMAKGIWF